MTIAKSTFVHVPELKDRFLQPEHSKPNRPAGTPDLGMPPDCNHEPVRHIGFIDEGLEDV